MLRGTLNKSDKAEYKALILLSDEYKAAGIRRSDSVLLMAVIRTNQYHVFHNLGAHNALRPTQCTKIFQFSTERMEMKYFLYKIIRILFVLNVQFAAE
jgi:hypothetical protein